MSFIRRHPFLTFISVFGLFIMIIGLEMLNTIEDVKLMFDIMNGRITVPPMPRSGAPGKPPRYSLALTTGLAIPPNLSEEVGKKAGSAWQASENLFPGKYKADNVYELVASHTPLALRIATRLASHASVLPPLASMSDIVDLSASIPNFREIRSNARLFAFMAHDLARQGRTDEAWVLALGPLLLAYYQEYEESGGSGQSLISRMISVAVRKIGSRALYELAPQLNIDRKRGLATLELITRIERGLPSIIQYLNREALLLPHFSETLAHALSVGAARKTFFQRRSLAMQTLSTPASVKKHLDPLYEPLRKVDGLPWTMVAPATASFTSLLNDIQMRTGTPSKQWMAYLFQPSHLIIEYMIAMSTPNCRKAIEQDYLCRSSTLGMGVAYVLAGYHHDHRKWPASLADAEKWSGVTFPLDVITGDPFRYEVDVSGTPHLFSPGADLISGNSDDLEFLPFPVPAVAESPRTGESGEEAPVPLVEPPGK